VLLVARWLLQLWPLVVLLPVRVLLVLLLFPVLLVRRLVKWQLLFRV
jgi:hypothetical protein